VTPLPSEPNLIVARKNFPADNLRELIAWLKKNPDKATAGTSGVGGPSYMAALFFQKETGTRFQLLPYRGISLALQDLLAGQIDLIGTGPSVLLSFSPTARSRLTR
jgi:tripartite-type tricarboxylate transporter receptor subunit TctC